MVQTLEDLSPSSAYMLQYFYNVEDLNYPCHIEVALGDQQADLIIASRTTQGYVQRSVSLRPNSTSGDLQFYLHTIAQKTCTVTFDAITLTLSELQPVQNTSSTANSTTPNSLSSTATSTTSTPLGPVCTAQSQPDALIVNPSFEDNCPTGSGDYIAPWVAEADVQVETTGNGDFQPYDGTRYM